MTMYVNVQEAKTHLSALLTRVETGEHIVIARRDLAVAELIPIRQDKVALGFWPGTVSDEAVAPLDDGELALWDAT